MIICLTLICALLFSFIAVIIPSANAYENKNGRVNADSLYVRSGPGTGNSSLGNIYQGEAVNIIGEESDGSGNLWYQITYKESSGYVMAKYISVVNATTYVDDATFEASIADFPESYKPYLRQLHAYYPNWVFKAQNTGLDWNASLDAESALGMNTVPSNSITSWKSTQAGAYNWETGTWVGLDGASWVAASREIIAYYMDPRNFLDVNTVFQFLDLNYDASIQTVEGVQNIISGTFMDPTSSYHIEGDETDYANALFTAGSAYGVNPYVLASMIIQEQGGDGSTAIYGTHSSYPGYYNYFNIGAYTANGMDAVTRGLWYASGANNGATTYSRPWNTREAAINGGTEWYAQQYIKDGQTTLYLKKYNVQGSAPYQYQYMTNVAGAYSESLTLAREYNDTIRSNALVFLIPVFSNMPETPATKPTDNSSPNYMLSDLSVTGLSFTTAFARNTYNYTVIIPDDTESIQINATAYDPTTTVKGTGTIPIVAGTSSLSVVATAASGASVTYSISVIKESSISAEFTNTYPIADNIISNILCGTTAADFKSKLIQKGTAVVTDAGGNAVQDTTALSTGMTVSVYAPSGILFGSYTLCVKGDINGDGSIAINDIICIRNYLLGTASYSGAALLAADVNGSGDVAINDIIVIRNHLLGTSTIS